MPSRNSEPVRKMLVSLPESIAERVDFHTWDPVYNKPSYGARSQLIARLLLEWLQRKEKSKEYEND